MKKTEIMKELRNSDAVQLQERINTLSKELVSLRLQVGNTHMKDYSRFRKFRKIIARIKTILQEKQPIK